MYSNWCVSLDSALFWDVIFRVDAKHSFHTTLSSQALCIQEKNQTINMKWEFIISSRQTVLSICSYNTNTYILYQSIEPIVQD